MVAASKTYLNCCQRLELHFNRIACNFDLDLEYFVKYLNTYIQKLHHKYIKLFHIIFGRLI